LNANLKQNASEIAEKTSIFYSEKTQNSQHFFDDTFFAVNLSSVFNILFLG